MHRQVIKDDDVVLLALQNALKDKECWDFSKFDIAYQGLGSHIVVTLKKPRAYITETNAHMTRALEAWPVLFGCTHKTKCLCYHNTLSYNKKLGDVILTIDKLMRWHQVEAWLETFSPEIAKKAMLQSIKRQMRSAVWEIPFKCSNVKWMTGEGGAYYDASTITELTTYAESIGFENGGIIRMHQQDDTPNKFSMFWFPPKKAQPKEFGCLEITLILIFLAGMVSLVAMELYPVYGGIAIIILCIILIAMCMTWGEQMPKEELLSYKPIPGEWPAIPDSEVFDYLAVLVMYAGVAYLVYQEQNDVKASVLWVCHNVLLVFGVGGVLTRATIGGGRLEWYVKTALAWVLDKVTGNIQTTQTS